MRFSSNGEALEPTIEVKMIGHVKNDVEEGRVGNWREMISEIVLKDEYEQLLDGIEEFSHIVVIFWMNKVEGYRPKVHPRGRQDIPEQGVFATRTPNRPNPIGISSVRLIKREGASLTVAGLDCFNGTPVLDIKPFTPRSLEIADIRMPEWMEDLFKKDRNP